MTDIDILKGFGKSDNETTQMLEKALNAANPNTKDLIPESAGKGSMALQHIFYGDPDPLGKLTEEEVKEYHKKRCENAKILFKMPT